MRMKRGVERKRRHAEGNRRGGWKTELRLLEIGSGWGVFADAIAKYGVEYRAEEGFLTLADNLAGSDLKVECGQFPAIESFGGMPAPGSSGGIHRIRTTQLLDNRPHPGSCLAHCFPVRIAC
ncbi:MAG TPA: hypothetical protein PL033_02475 [Candidatus Brocadiia bacterium]|nr:hypothetical protein [Candidatus Brocadiia bacterium]